MFPVLNLKLVMWKWLKELDIDDCGLDSKAHHINNLVLTGSKMNSSHILL